MPSSTQARDLREQGRRGARIRWARTTPAERKAQSKVARAGIDRKYTTQARSLFARAGIPTTDEQVQTAARNMLRADLASRLVIAREKAVAAKHEAKRLRDIDRAARQVHQFESLIRAHVPGLPDRLASRVGLHTADQELRAPDGYQPSRLKKRLELTVEALKECVP